MQIVTAHRLTDGIVLYLSSISDGHFGWSPTINEACTVTTEEGANRLLELALELELKDQEATGSYLIEVTGTKDDLQPVKYKEHIRAFGPSVQTDLNNIGHERAA